MIAMDVQDEITARLMNALRGSNYGLSIADLSRKTAINRNTVAKYLSILCTLGQAEMHVVGPAQVYHLSNRIPITPIWLSTMPMPYVLVSNEGIIFNVSTKFAEQFLKPDEDIAGKTVEESGVPILEKVADMTEYNLALEGKISKHNDCEIVTVNRHSYSCWTYPAVFADGSPGIVISLFSI